MRGSEDPRLGRKPGAATGEQKFDQRDRDLWALRKAQAMERRLLRASIRVVTDKIEVTGTHIMVKLALLAAGYKLNEVLELMEKAKKAR